MMRASKCGQRRGTGGFTLIEILAALAILSVALFALLDAHYSALNLHVTTDEEVTFREFIELTVGRAETSVLQGVLTDSGDFGLRYPDYAWSFEAEAQEPPRGEGGERTFDTSIVPEGLIPLYHVNVSVTSPSAEERRYEFFVFNTGLPQEEDGNRMFNSVRTPR